MGDIGDIGVIVVGDELTSFACWGHRGHSSVAPTAALTAAAAAKQRTAEAFRRVRAYLKDEAEQRRCAPDDDDHDEPTEDDDGGTSGDGMGAMLRA
eukprot:9651725-Heterocapsa_arctica.AAC.1